MYTIRQRIKNNSWSPAQTVVLKSLCLIPWEAGAWCVVPDKSSTFFQLRLGYTFLNKNIALLGTLQVKVQTGASQSRLDHTECKKHPSSSFIKDAAKSLKLLEMKEGQCRHEKLLVTFIT